MKSSSPVPSPAQVIRWANTRRFPSLPRRLRRRRSRRQRPARRWRTAMCATRRRGVAAATRICTAERGGGRGDPNLYREVVARIRCADTDVIINLTAGMGGDLEIGAGEEPMRFGQGTDLVGGLTRLVHV